MRPGREREARQIAVGKAKREQSSRQALFEQAEAYWNSPAGIAEAAHIQAFCEEWERQGRPATATVAGAKAAEEDEQTRYDHLSTSRKQRSRHANPLKSQEILS